MSTNPSVNQKSKFVKIGEASHILGVSIDTLRRWEKAGKIETMRTPGGTRLYKVKSLTKFQTKFEAKHARRIQRVSTIAAVASAQAEENALLQASSLEFPPISTEPQVSEDITPSIVETAPVVEDDHSIFHEMFSSAKTETEKEEVAEIPVVFNTAPVNVNDYLGKHAEYEISVPEYKAESVSDSNEVIAENEQNNDSEIYADSASKQDVVEELISNPIYNPNYYGQSSNSNYLADDVMHSTPVVEPEQKTKAPDNISTYYTSQQSKVSSSRLAGIFGSPKLKIYAGLASILLIFVLALPLFAANLFSQNSLPFGLFNGDVQIADNSSEVLAESTIAQLNKYLEINADTSLNGTLAVEGEGIFIGNITAPNIVYSLVAGNNITISGDPQNPTISTTGGLTTEVDTLASVTSRGASTSTPLQLLGGITGNLNLSDTLVLGRLASDPGSATNGATYYNTDSNKFRCYINGSWQDCDTDTDTVGSTTTFSGFDLVADSGTAETIEDGDTVSLLGGNGILTTTSADDTVTFAVNTGNGLTFSSSQLTVQLPTSGDSAVTFSNSGLELTTDGLALIRGCGHNEIMKWDNIASQWECGIDQGLSGAVVTIQEDGADVSTVASILNFDGENFSLNESPAGQVNIELAAVPQSLTGTFGNFDVAGTLTSGTGNSFSVSTAGTITIASGQTLTIGTTSINETTGNTDSGAYLVGVFDEFANSNATTVQGVLNDLDAAVGSGASKFSQATGFIYLTNSTDDFVMGGTTIANGSLYFDESAGNLALGTEGSLDGVLTLRSSGAVTDPTITTDATGNLIATSANFNITTTGINSTAIGQTTAAAGSFTSLSASGATTLNGNVTLGDAAADLLSFSGTIQGASPFTFEGATADGFETTFALTDPTADRTITFPNNSGTVVVAATSPLSIAADGTISCSTCVTSGSGTYVSSLNGLTGVLSIANATGSGATITIDDATTTTKGIASFASSNFSVTSGAVSIATGGVGSTEIANGSVANVDLANSSVTVNTSGPLGGGGAVSLGGSLTLTCATCVTDSTTLFTLASTSGSSSTITSGDTVTIAAGTGISSTGNGSGTVTIANTGVTSNVAGTGISVSGGTGDVTITNTGVTSITGTANQVIASASTGSVTLSLPQDIATSSTPTFAGLTLNGTLAANGNVTLGDAAADLLTFSGTIQGASPFTFEGASADGFETTFALTDPTADRTITFPNNSGTVVVAATAPLSIAADGTISCSTCLTTGGGSVVESLNGLTGALTIANATTSGGDTITIDDATTTTKGIASFATANFAVASGAVSIKSGGVTTTEILDGTVSNTDLANSSITFAGDTGSGTRALGQTLTIAGSGIATTAYSAGTITVTATEADTLAAVTGRGATTATGITLTQNGNTATSFALGIVRNTDTTPDGYLIRAQNAALNTNLFAVDINGLITTASVNSASIVNGSVANADLTNSNVTVNTSGPLGGGGAVSLGGSLTLTCATCVTDSTTLFTLASTSGSSSTITSGDTVTISAGTGISSTGNGSGTVTIANTGVTSNVAGTGISVSGATGAVTITNDGVVSLDGGTGAISVANATFATGTLTIDNASTAQKGIAQFNSTNFTASSGTINTIQDIDTSAAPTFAGITLNGTLTANGNSTFGNAATDTVTFVAIAQNYAGNSFLTLEGASADGFETTLDVVDPTADNTIVLPDNSGTVVVAATGPLSINATTGVISCATCLTSGGGSYVTSLNGLQGALTIANATGSGATITIDDATTTTKGIASFATANFAVSSGAVSIKSGGVTTTEILDGTVSNTDLANSTINLSYGTGVSGDASVALGGTLNISNTGVTSNVAGSGISVSGATGAVTITNTGVLSITGTANQVIASASTGAVTLSLPQSIATSSTPTFGGLTLTGNLGGTTGTFSSSLSAVQSGNTSTDYALYLRRNTDTTPAGFLIQAQNAAQNANLFAVDINGLITTASVNSASIVDGSVANADLANSSITVNTSGPLGGGGAVSLGGSLTLTCATCVTDSTTLFTLASTSGSSSTITSGDTVTIAAGTGISSTGNGSGTVTIANTGVTSNVAGTGISVSGGTGAVTITNTGVTSLNSLTGGLTIAGTTNQIAVNPSGATITLTTPQDIATSSTPTFAAMTLTPTSAAALTLNQYGTSAGETAEFRFMEGGATSTQYVGFKAPDSLTTSAVYTLPNHDSSAPSGDYVLTWQSGNTLEWKAAGGVGGVGDITEVIAGTGLTGGGASGSVTLDIGAGSGITVNANDIAVNLMATPTNGASSTTFSASGLEFVSGQLTMLQGCADVEVLAWDEGNDRWACTAASGIGGVGDITDVGDVSSGAAFNGTSGNTLQFEGATADGFEIALTGADATVDETITLPAYSGSVLLTQPFANGASAAQVASGASGSIIFINETGAGTPNLIELEVGGTDEFVVSNAGLISSASIDSTSVVDGSIANVDLTNSSITYTGDSGSGAISLGGTLTFDGNATQGVSTSYSAGTLSLTVADATTSTKGVSSFASGNFSVTSGAVSIATGGVGATELAATAVGAGSYGGQTTGISTFTVDADGRLTAAGTATLSSGGITDNTITATDIASTLTFADGDFIDLASIVHDDTALQGLRLPNTGATPSNPVSGEGNIAYDATNNAVIFYNGSAWEALTTATTAGDITEVIAGAGLTGGGTSGSVTLTVGGSSTITVNANDIAVTADSIGDTELAFNTGQNLTTSSAVTFSTVDTGQGANELYDMDQNVLTTSNVTFNQLTLTTDLSVANGGTGASSLTGLLIGNGAGAFTATTVSSGVSGQLSDETGSGALVFGTSPSLTTPSITTGITDSNGNELFNFTATGSAVNELTFANAASGNNPTWTLSGGGTNIGLNTVLKGTGVANFSSTTANTDVIAIAPQTGTATNTFTGTITSSDLTANRTYTLPDASGTFAVSASAPLALSAAGNLTCSTCVTSATTLFTLAATSGSSSTIVSGDTLTIAAGTGISTTGNGSDQVTIANTGVTSNVAGTGISVSGGTGAVTITNDGVLSLDGGTGAISVANATFATGTLTIDDASDSAKGIASFNVTNFTVTTGNVVIATGGVGATELAATTVSANSYGGQTTGISTFTVDADGRLTAAGTATLSSGGITDNTITATDIASTLTFADGDYIDLSAIAHDDTALQGLRLPNTGSTPSDPVSGEGQIAYDATSNSVIFYNGTAWETLTSIGTAGDITEVIAGAGLTGGGTTGSVTLTIGGSSTITVNANDIAVTADSITDTELAFNTGQNLTTSSAVTFSTVDTGQGANELYDMNQNVLTTSSVTFDTLTLTNALSVANGGTGAQTLTGILLGNGTSAVTGVTTSAGISGALSDETGSGALVFATSPSFTTPTLGVATATTINKVAFTAPATGSTLTIADGKTLTASNTLTFTGTDGTSFAFPSSSGTVCTTSTCLASTATLFNTAGTTGTGSIAGGETLTITGNGTQGVSAALSGDTFTVTVADATDTQKGVATFNTANFLVTTGDVTIKTGGVGATELASTTVAANSYGGQTTGISTFTVDADGRLTAAGTATLSTGGITDNTLTPTDFASTLTFADGDLIDLSAILHDDTAAQGLILPNTGATPSNPSAGEGYIAYDATSNAVIFYNGSAWETLTSTGTAGDITEVIAGAGLTGGGTSGSVTLTIGGSSTITVNANDIAVTADSITDTELAFNTGQNLTTSSAVTFATVNTGNGAYELFAMDQDVLTTSSPTFNALTLTTDLTVANGGTGASSLTGLLIGNGTSAFTATTVSSGISGQISDETGSGALVFATSPSFTTPSLGVATATSINGLTITSSTGTLTIANGKTFQVDNSLTFTGTDSTSFAFPSSSGTVCTTGTCYATSSTLFNTAGTTGTGSIAGGDTFTITGNATQGVSVALSGDTFTATVADATDTQKGVASYSSTFFSVSSGAVSIANDSLDFAQFEDTLDLDANQIVNQGTNTWTQNFTGTTTNGLTYNANSLTSGVAMNISSTSTALTTGGLASLDWSPGSATTATGDLFALNIGTNGTIGNIFNIKDAGSSIFSVSETAMTSNIPVNFTSPGDVAIAYDLNFTNSTASYINSQSSLNIVAGEIFNSSNLYLKTYNQGTVVIDSGATTGTSFELANNNLTTGTAASFTSSSVTSGSMINVAQTTSTFTGNLAQFSLGTGSGTAMNIANGGTGYTFRANDDGTYTDSTPIVFDASGNVLIGGTSETLANGSFTLGGEDLFVAGIFGVEGDIFTDGDLNIGAIGLNDVGSSNTTSGAALVGVYDEFDNSIDPLTVQNALDDLDAAITAAGSGASKWTVNTTPTPDTIYPTGASDGTGYDFAIGGTASGAQLFFDTSAGSLAIVGAFTGTTLDTGQGANELYDMDQNVLQASAVTFATIDTGNGANELFDMDQNVLTTSSVTFDTLTLTNDLTVANGGTGASTLTGLLIGNGTSAITGTTTSSGISGAISDETGSGALVFATSPSFTTPSLGAATATTINGLTLTSSTGTLTIANGKTLTANNTLTFDGTDGTTFTFPASSGTVCTTGSCYGTGATLFNTAGTTGTGSIDGGDTFTITGNATQGVSVALSGDTFTATVADATDTQKGVASFDSAFFTATSGDITIAADSLDFTELQDTLDLDAAMTLNQGTNTWTQNFTGTTTNGFTYNANSLTSGVAMSLASTSTALTTGGLMSLDWSPGSATTATGDLFALNIGTNGTIGNIFNIKDTGSSIFSVSETQFTTSLPANFTASGDTSFAYDIQFTNPVAAYIKSNAALTIAAGEVFNSSNLTLQTYNNGTVVIDSGATTGTSFELANNNLTTGTAASFTSTSITSGSMINVAQTTSTFTGNLAQISLGTGSGTALNVTNGGTGYGFRVNDDGTFTDSTPFVIEADGDVLLGGTSETLANTGFTMDGNDLYVAGMGGFEGNVYTDGAFVAGASTTYANGSISQSSGETLTIGTTSAGLTLQTTTSGTLAVTSAGALNLTAGSASTWSASLADSSLLNLSAINVSGTGEGLILPQNASACSAATAEGQICWDTAGEDLYIGNGSTAVQMNAGGGSGTITAVGNITTGDAFTAGVPGASFIFADDGYLGLGASAGRIGFDDLATDEVDILTATLDLNAGLITNIGNSGTDFTTGGGLTLAGDLVAGQTTSKIGFGGAVSGSDYLMNIELDSTQDWARGINITQANNVDEDSIVFAIANTANVGTAASNRSIENLDLSLAPTATATNRVINMKGIDQSLSLTNTTLGNSQTGSARLYGYGVQSSILGNPIINQTNADDDTSAMSFYSSSNSINITPTITSVIDAGMTFYGSHNQVDVNSAGNAGLTSTVYGVSSVVTGDLTTTGTTAHYGGYFTASGTADANYGILVGAGGATLNHALYVASGNATFADSTLLDLSAINNSSATEGLILPQLASACAAATAEGQVCWDTAGEDLYIGNGTTAIQMNTGGGSGTINAVGNITTGDAFTAGVPGASFIFADNGYLGLGASAGRIAFSDAGTDEVDILTATLDLNAGLITNIGDTGTDFTTGGGLTLAGNLLAGQTTSKIGFGGAVSGSDYLLNMELDSTQDWARGINITQANNVNEDSAVFAITNTANLGSPSTGRYTDNLNLALTPTATVTNLSTGYSVRGIANSIDTSNLTLGNSSSSINRMYVRGEENSITGTPIINNANADEDTSYHSFITSLNELTITPTLTNVTQVTGGYTAGHFNTQVTSAGNSAYNVTAYGINVSSGGNLTTTGTTTHYGGAFTASGTADTNYGIYVSAQDATTNHALYVALGRATFADSTLLDLSAINNSSATEGLILPQLASACASATAEGQVCWDTAGEDLYIGNGATAVQMNAGGGSGTVTETGTNANTQISYFTADQNITSSSTFTFDPAGSLLVGSNFGVNVSTGAVTAASVNKVAITAPASSATLTIADGKTLTVSNTLTFTGTDSTSFAFPASSGTVCTTASCEDAITFANGLTRTGDAVALGGALTGNTTITQDSAETLTFSNTGTGETAFDLTSTGDLNIKDNGTTFFAFMDNGTAAYTGGTGIDTETALGFTANSLTSGTLMQLTSTSLTSGSFFDINNGSSIFNVSQSAFTTSLPVNFTSPGDVSIANDIQFTNPTASYIKSYSALTLQAGDPAGSSNLTLGTYNNGSVYIPSNVTTAYGVDIDADALTTGSAMNISSIATTGTGSGASYLLDLNRSGTNANASHTAYGVYSSVTNTGTTSTNVAAYLSASGASTNYALQVANGTARFNDGTMLDLSNINMSANTEGLRLPQTTSCTSGTAEGQVCWDTDNDTLYIGDGTTANALTAGASTWNGLANPTATQTLTFDDAELNAWTISSNTETFWTMTADSLTTGRLFDFSLDGLTSGIGMNMSSTSTALTSGSLAAYDWTPGSATTATGDLFKLTIGANGTTTGNLFNIIDGTSSIFSVSETALTTSLPANFTATGDVSIAYDLNFTNPTVGTIKSTAPLLIAAGETFNSSNLTLQTYNYGSVVIDSAITSGGAGTKYNLYNSVADSTANVSLIYDYYGTLSLTGNAAKFGIGSYQSVTSTSTVGDTLIGYQTVVDHNAATASGNKTIYGVASTVTNDGITDAAGTHLIYGGVFSATGNTGGTSVAVGVQGTASGADLNYPFYMGTAPVSSGTAALCWDGAGDSPINDCSGAPVADYAEVYPTENSMTYGEIAVAGNETVETNVFSMNKESQAEFEETRKVSKLLKSTSQYQKGIIGITSENYGDFTSTGHGSVKDSDHPIPVALNGRVALKVTAENGTIEVGDYITTSSVAGHGMKATRPGQMVGKALEPFNGSGTGRIMVYVDLSYADPSNMLANMTLDNDGSIIMPKIKTNTLTLNQLDVQTLTVSGTSINLTQLAQVSNSFTQLAAQTQSLDDQVTALATAQDQTEDRILGLETSDASQAAALAQAQELGQQAVDHALSLDEKVASTSSTIDSLSAKIDELLAGFGNNTESTDSGDIDEDLIASELVNPSTMIATDSAELNTILIHSEATVSGMLQAYDSVFQNSLKSLGETMLGNTTVAGDVTVDGTLTIASGNRIDAIGTLFLQTNPLAELIDLFNGAVQIAQNGNITTIGEVKAASISTDSLKVTETLEDSSIGSGVIPAGAIEIPVFTNKIGANTKVFVTVTSEANQPLVVSEKIEGAGFVVKIQVPEISDITFDWFIVN